MADYFDNHYVIYKKKKNSDGWSIKKEFKQYWPTAQAFSTIPEAETWLEENYAKKSKYDSPIISHIINGSTGDLMTLAEWKIECDNGGFIDYDGYGSQLDENYEEIGGICPSDYTEAADGDDRRPILPETKYILWYNR